MTPSSAPQHQDSIGWLLNAAALRVNKLMQQALADVGLTQGQFAILKTLAEQDNITQIDIARCVNMPADQMSRQIDVLQTMGLLGRHADPHSRRATRIVLTDQGRAMAPQLFAIARQVNGAFVQGLSDSDCQALKATLQNLVLAHPK